ncbi:hypothetical protein [Bradyrhizobium sp. CB1015]|uniref:hypothetical protein n=1 Tax=Bradyrhizobium sp. CB1015 TaxID=2976822 RepID=UPI0021AAFB79|nr:hypothetical protein [Bradyrhizobium sp. CB1015]UWU90607.1 hypothetical protein N2604_29660 [Bradyrhizobium sp. CB1015]
MEYEIAPASYQPYQSKWIFRLAEAAEWLANATGISLEQAKSDICRALSDGVIDFLAELACHAARSQRSDSKAGPANLEIPRMLKSEDFDWEQSRPRSPWWLHALHRHEHGLWHLASIELSRPDLKKALLAVAATNNVRSKHDQRTRQRVRPHREAADRAIIALWPDGVPSPLLLPNKRLVDRVGQWLKEQNIKIAISSDTILRAAGSRK